MSAPGSVGAPLTERGLVCPVERTGGRWDLLRHTMIIAGPAPAVMIVTTMTVNVPINALTEL